MKNPALWKQIQQFQFDAPGDVYGFSLRLAKENYWTRDFTRRAIEEYRRFMYLAAVSEQMVSPSHVIDQVWHLHLIYTKSYDDLCTILGKKVQHIPATHNPEEGRRYHDARERTNGQYRNEFGEPPAEIWSSRMMTDTLNLQKAKYKLRTVIIYGLLFTALLTIPLFFALRPFYAVLSPGNFFTGYLMLVAVSALVLQSINRMRLKKILGEFSASSFIYRLDPAEVIYLRYQRTDSIVNGHMNQLIKHKHVKMYGGDGQIEAAEANGSFPPEEMQIMQMLSSTGKIRYARFMEKINARTIFSNVQQSMDAFSKFFLKSQKFHRLFYLNLAVCSLLLLLGMERIAVGISRDKPVVYISIVVALIAAALVFHLYFLTRQMFSRTIQDYYEQKVKSHPDLRADWTWSYMILGAALFTPEFTRMANMSLPERMHSNTSTGGSGCGGTGGSSCGGGGSSCGGGSCGGCGGCGS